ncbi:hypothetical protein BCV70DRAFT_114383 [Testicularia cyperi]|uniref:Uncharacterized protein n=1 Tax=Testicularia cyperi TaxID=1882483 RepID=A0A317XNN3_9BASI|nr:hypothetical protein BCV70DRAFT_114383 [Testicularia cyperi]
MRLPPGREGKADVGRKRSRKQRNTTRTEDEPTGKRKGKGKANNNENNHAARQAILKAVYICYLTIHSRRRGRRRVGSREKEARQRRGTDRHPWVRRAWHASFSFLRTNKHKCWTKGQSSRQPTLHCRRHTEEDEPKWGFDLGGGGSLSKPLLDAKGAIREPHILLLLPSLISPLSFQQASYLRSTRTEQYQNRTMVVRRPSVK